MGFNKVMVDMVREEDVEQNEEGDGLLWKVCEHFFVCFFFFLGLCFLLFSFWL